MITQRSVLLGFVGFCFYLIALVNSLPAFYYALTWLAVGLLFSSLGIALLSLVGLEVQWNCERTRGLESIPGEVEDPPMLSLYLANKGTFNKTGLVVEITVKSVVGSRPQGELTTQRFVIEALTSGSSLQTSLPLRTLPRGRFELVGIRLVGSDILGLFRSSKKLKISSDPPITFIVAPGVVTELNVGPSLGTTSGLRRGEIEARFRVGHGEDLRGTRPYAPGDDLRRVHWKSTARAGELVVKEHHERGRDVSVVVWDGAQGTDWGHGSAREWGLRCVHSCQKAFARSGTLCDLAILDGKGVHLRSQGQGTISPELILTTLAEAGEGRTTSLLEASSFLPGDYRHIYLVSASLSPELVALVQKCRGRRSEVRVLLLDGATFNEAVRGWQFGLGRHSVPDKQEVVLSGSEGGFASVTLDAGHAAFEDQGRALELAGAHVMLLKPGSPDPEVGPQELRNAVGFLTGRGFQSSLDG